MAKKSNTKQEKDVRPHTEKRTMAESPSQVHHAHIGPILGVIVVVLVLILGGLYLWGSTLEEEQQNTTTERQIENNEPETPRSKADAQIMGTVSPSDELDAIETDLENTNFEGIDADLDTADRELEAETEN